MHYLYEIKIKKNKVCYRKIYASKSFKRVLRHQQDVVRYSLYYEPLILFSTLKQLNKQIKQYFKIETIPRAWVILESEKNDKTNKQY